MGISVTYSCSNCGKRLTRNVEMCPSCGAVLEKVICHRCGYIGGREEFSANDCPRCGGDVSFLTSTSADPAPSLEIRSLCPFCNAVFPPELELCPSCGKDRIAAIGMVRTGKAFSRLVVSAGINILAGMFTSVILGWAFLFPLLLGIPMMVVGVLELANAISARRRLPAFVLDLRILGVLEIASAVCGALWNIYFGVRNLMQAGDPHIRAYQMGFAKPDAGVSLSISRLLAIGVPVAAGIGLCLAGAGLFVIFTIAQIESNQTMKTLPEYAISVICCPVPVVLAGAIFVVTGILVGRRPIRDGADRIVVA